MSPQYSDDDSDSNTDGDGDTAVTGGDKQPAPREVARTTYNHIEARAYTGSHFSST